MPMLWTAMGWTNRIRASGWSWQRSDIVKASGFKVFADVVKKGGIVKALNAKGCVEMSRKEIDDLGAFAAVYRAKGLAWIKVREGWQSPIAKFFTEEEKARLTERIGMAPATWSFSWPISPKSPTKPWATCATIWVRCSS
jgi:aspartyl-tRNA synthetase